MCYLLEELLPAYLSQHQQLSPKAAQKRRQVVDDPPPDIFKAAEDMVGVAEEVVETPAAESRPNSMSLAMLVFYPSHVF